MTKQLEEFATQSRNKSENLEPALARKARARHAGNTEETIRSNGESANTVNQAVADLAAGSEDQSSVRSDVATTKQSNRRGRPRKEQSTQQELPFSLQKAPDFSAKEKIFFATRKKIIRKVGEAFEKELPEPSNVCEAIKEALAEEIRQKIISARTIETHCLDKWKKKTKPRKIHKNAGSSFSEHETIARGQVIEGHDVAQEVSFPAQQIYKITKDKFAAVKEAMDGSNNECYLRFNEKYELESIETDQSQPAEPTVRE